MSERHLFGTDGIRGRAGEWPLEPELLERLGRVLATRIGGGDSAPRVLIGHDGRESGEWIVQALAAGLTTCGADVDVLGLATTPCTAYLTASGPYGAGVMVSASHNPAQDNGIKLLGRDGGKLGDVVEHELEQPLLADAELPAAPCAGTIQRVEDAVDEYVAWLRSTAFPKLDLDGMRVLVDCAQGAASLIAPQVLYAFGAEPITIRDQPDGSNINDGCGSQHPEVAADAVLQAECAIGVSLDGDADRGILIDGAGRILDGDALLAGLGEHGMRQGTLPHSTVVATVMSNLALERRLRDCGATLLRTQVGDRYVAAAMREGGYSLGGEKSGHMLFGKDHGFRGDGLYTLLRVLDSLRIDCADPTDFAAGYVDLPQKLVNLPVLKRAPLNELPTLAAAVEAEEAELGDRGRTVVRFSGTELRLRLMVEAVDDTLVAASLARLEAAARADGILIE